MVTVTFRSQRLSDEEEAKDPDEENEKRCAAKDQNENHYIEAIRVTPRW